MNTADLLKKIYADFEAVPPALHPEFKLISPGNNPIAGTFDGLDGMVAHLNELQEVSGGSMNLVGHTFTGEGDWGMAVSHITASHKGHSMDVQGMGLWQLKDGKLYRHWEAASDPDAWDAFWTGVSEG